MAVTVCVGLFESPSLGRGVINIDTTRFRHATMRTASCEDGELSIAGTADVGPARAQFRRAPRLQVIHVKEATVTTCLCHREGGKGLSTFVSASKMST